MTFVLHAASFTGGEMARCGGDARGWLNWTHHQVQNLRPALANPADVASGFADGLADPCVGLGLGLAGGEFGEPPGDDVVYVQERALRGTCLEALDDLGHGRAQG